MTDEPVEIGLRWKRRRAPATSGECGAVTEVTVDPFGAVVVVTVMRLCCA